MVASIAPFPVPQRQNHKVDDSRHNANGPEGRQATKRLEVIVTQSHCDTQKRKSRKGKPAEALQ